MKHGSSYNVPSLNLRYGYRNLDRYNFANQGLSQDLSFDIGLPIFSNSASFYKINYNHDYYLPLYKLETGGKFVFNFKANVGYGRGIGDFAPDLPFLIIIN